MNSQLTQGLLYQHLTHLWLSSVPKSDAHNSPKEQRKHTLYAFVLSYNIIMFDQNVATIILDIIKIMSSLLALWQRYLILRASLRKPGTTCVELCLAKG
jgi:hypothetical protein